MDYQSAWIARRADRLLSYALQAHLPGRRTMERAGRDNARHESRNDGRRWATVSHKLTRWNNVKINFSSISSRSLEDFLLLSLWSVLQFWSKPISVLSTKWKWGPGLQRMDIFSLLLLCSLYVQLVVVFGRILILSCSDVTALPGETSSEIMLQCMPWCHAANQ